MPTVDDYIEISPGKWARRDASAASINLSTIEAEVMDGKSGLTLIWAKDLMLDQTATQGLWGTFLFPGSVHLLSGEAGVGKTTFLYNLAVKACRGEEFAGIPLQKPLRVLYLDLETPYDLRPRKVNLIAERSSPDGLAFVVSACLDHDMPKLALLVKEHAFSLVIIDTINTAFLTKDEDDNAEANRQIRPLRNLAQETGCAIILAHHIGKGEQGKKVYKSRGASARAASADVVINLEAVTEEVVRLEVVKSRWTSNDRLFLRKAGEDIFEVTEVRGEEDINLRLRAQALIVGLLPSEHEGDMQTRDIIAQLESQGFTKPTIERALSDLVKVGKVTRVKRGVYAYPSAMVAATITPSINHTLGVDVMDGTEGFEEVWEDGRRPF